MEQTASIPPLATLNHDFQTLLHRVEQTEERLRQYGIDRGSLNTATILYLCNEVGTIDDVVAMIANRPLRVRES